eukprot:443454-Amphidinium_carterae.1
METKAVHTLKTSQRNTFRDHRTQVFWEQIKQNTTKQDIALGHLLLGLEGLLASEEVRVRLGGATLTKCYRFVTAVIGPKGSEPRSVP